MVLAYVDRGFVFKHIQSILQLSLLSGLCLLSAGCQPSKDPQWVADPVDVKEASSAAVDLNQMCQDIENDMQQINAERTTLALEQINQNLKICLPLLNHEQQQHLIQQSTAMYQRFLSVPRNENQQIAFEQYAFDMAQHPTIQQEHLQALHLRDQYLLKHKGQAFIELVDRGEGELNFRRSPEYLERIFAPYLPKAEKVFIQQLAAQNREVVLQNGNLLISPNELLVRALYWQNYLKQYPNSSYSADARYLMQQYAYYLFFGSSKTQVSQYYTDRLSITADHLDAIIRLAKGPDSMLAETARRYLNFLDLSPEQQLEAEPDDSLSQQQRLERYSKIESPKHPKGKDCFIDAICI